MGFFAVQASYEGLNYVFGPSESISFIFREKYTSNIELVRTHGVCSVTALCLGLVAFVQETRRRKVHAWVGRVYALGVLIGGLTAIPMALMAEGGWSTRIAFLLQAGCWMGTMIWAVRAARARKMVLHRRSMIRNYSITYSAVISRLLLHGLQSSGLEFQQIYPFISWTWVLGLMVGEWWIWYSDGEGQPG